MHKSLLPNTINEQQPGVVPIRPSVLPVRGPASHGGESDNASLLAIYGGTLRARHFQCLKRLSESAYLERENLTTLIVFHLVETGLLARNTRGEMNITSLGASLLADYERLAARGAN